MKERLRTFFRGREDVEIAYLFGSAARNESGPTSDVDIAVVFDSDRVPESLAGRRRLELTVELVDFLDGEEVDVVDLERAPPLLAHRVIRDGVVLAERARDRRIALEERIIHRYIDTKPLRERQWEHFRDRLQPGD